MIPFTFIRWCCLMLAIATGPVAPIAGVLFFVSWAGIGLYQIRNRAL